MGKSNNNADALSRVPFSQCLADTNTPSVQHAEEVNSIEVADMVAMQKQCHEIKPIYEFIAHDVVPRDKTLANVLWKTRDQYIIDEDGGMPYLFSKQQEETRIYDQTGCRSLVTTSRYHHETP